MPLYEYHCTACGADFEALVSFAQADQVECELCHCSQTERLNSSFAAATKSTGADFKGCFPTCGPSS